MSAHAHTIAGDPRAQTYVALAVLGAAAIVAVEALLVPDHLVAAQIVDALLVLALVNAGPAREAHPMSAAAGAALAAVRCLAIVPLIRVVALGLPMRDWSEPVALLAVALPVGAVALRLAPVVGLPLGRLFTPRIALPEVYGCFAGAILGLLAFLAGAPRLWPEGAADGRIAAGICAAVVAACTAELVFRGLLQGTLQRAAGRPGMLIAAALFTATYLHTGSTQFVLTIALLSIIFGHVFARTGALLGVMAGHVAFLLGAGAVWPALLDPAEVDLIEPETTIALIVAIAATTVLACWQPVGGPARADPAEPG